MAVAHSKPLIDQDDVNAVTSILTSGMIAKGKAVQDFEAMVAKAVGAEEGVACGNGTAAIILALKTLDIAADDEVILPTYVCKDVIQAITALGAVPVLCDIGLNWRMTATDVVALIGPRTGAIIVVHTFGFISDVDSIVALGVPVIADASQAFGVSGSEEITIYSFHATKCLTTGEGGMAMFRRPEQARRGRALRDDSISRMPFTMSDLQATLGQSQLSKYDTFLTRRFQIAKRYSDAFAESCITLPYFDSEDVPFRYPVQTKLDFDTVSEAFSQRGVSVRRGVDSLLHRQLGKTDTAFPNSVSLFHKTVSLPLYPALSETDVARVIRAGTEIFVHD